MSLALSKVYRPLEGTGMLKSPIPMTDILKVFPGGTIKSLLLIEQLYLPLSQSKVDEEKKI